MSESSQDSAWPDYLPLPRDDIFALGVITLSYCMLENTFMTLLSNVAQWSQFQSGAVFHRLPNNHRLGILSELLAKTTIPIETKEDIKYFATGFHACATSRNFIMHSSSAGLHSEGLILQRHSRAGARLECYLTLSDLKQIADDMNGFAIFGAVVDSDVRSYSAKLSKGHPEEYRGQSPLTSQKKPPMPKVLCWNPSAYPEGQIF